MLGRGSGSGSGSLMPLPLPLLLLLWLQTLLLLPGVEATWTAYQEYLSGLDSSSSPEQQQRHEITFSPNSPWKSIAAVTTAGQRNQTCVVESHGDFVTDDSAAIVDAVKKCNPGGKVVFPEGKTYVVGKAMDLTGLRGMDIGMFFLSIFFFGGRGVFKLLILFFFSFFFSFYRYSRIHPIQQRHRLLASQCVQTNLSKRYDLLPAGWCRCECLWWWHARWKWTNLVRSLRQGQIDLEAHSIRNCGLALGKHLGPALQILSAVLQLGGE